MLIAAALFLALLQSSDSEHRRAVELASAGNLSEAKAILLLEQRKNPNDKRFPTELAGIGFKAADYHEAQRHIRRALQIDPEDVYANDFLATLYLLENNIDAALKYWNRIGRPRIENVATSPDIRIDPTLWDRALAFSPASTLSLEEFRNTKARLQSLDLLARTRFELLPAGDAFDLFIHPLMRADTLGTGKWGALAAAGRGLPYHTVEYELRNLRSAGLNVSTLVRWDTEARRASVRAAMPFRKNPQHRFDVAFDARDEIWEFSQEEFQIKKLKLSAGFHSRINSRWSWGSRINVSNRRSEKAGDRSGTLLTYEANVGHEVISLPEKRLTMELGTSFEFGRDFTKTTLQTLMEWHPRPASDDYRATVSLRFGTTSGSAPFDEYFALGLDRDHDLLMRGHPGRHDGRKGESPVGEAFALGNADLQKNLLKQGLFTLAAGPFLDVARIADEQAVLLDAGIQIRLSMVNGISLGFSYGRDLRTGRNAFFYR
jgi:tetratricopeptide (TPR) repeat protein